MVQPASPKFLKDLTVKGDDQADVDARSVLDPDQFARYGAPYEAMERLRNNSPVHRVDLPGIAHRVWLVTRYDDVVAVSRDDANYSSSTGNTLIEVAMGPNSASLPGIDPPQHTRYRRLISKAFTPRNVARLEGRIREQATQIVDDILAKGEFDAVPDISAEISLSVIADVLGVPTEDRHQIFHWSNAIGSLGIEDADYAPDAETVTKALQELLAYCAQLVQKYRSDGFEDNILCALLEAEVDDVGLTAGQLNEFFVLLAIAGNETTRNTLSHGILALSDHPDQRAQLHADRSLIPGVIDEMLRWSTPVLHFRRTVTQTVELGGQQLKPGDWVLMHYLSANRDESVFPDPLTFDIHRDQSVPHAAFGGGGAHYCLGAQLAKLELRVMLEELYRRVPDLHVAGEPVRLRSSFFHGIKNLPCRTGS